MINRPRMMALAAATSLLGVAMRPVPPERVAVVDEPGPEPAKPPPEPGPMSRQQRRAAERRARKAR